MSKILYPLVLILSLLTLNESVYAQAKSAFIGPLAFTNGGEMVSMDDGIYERYQHPYLGSYLTIVTSSNANPSQGDTWSLGVYYPNTMQIIGNVVLTYDASSDCVLYQGSPVKCGLYVSPDEPKIIWTYFTIYFYTECLSVDEYELWSDTPDNSAAWTFTPVRFKPSIEQITAPESLRPRLARRATETSKVSVLVQDDLGCGRPLEGVNVALKNSYVPGSGGHANIIHEEPITGHYSIDTDFGGTIPSQEQRSITFIGKGGEVVEEYTVADTVEGRTNSWGKFAADYTPGVFGGEEQIVATASIEYVSEKDPAAETSEEGGLAVKVPGLAELEEIGLYHRFNFWTLCGSFEPEARWLTSVNRERAYQLARLWYDFHGEKLSYNDASLVNGGVIEKNTVDTGCHQTHRRGIHIDVNNLRNKLRSDCRDSEIEGVQICRYDDLVDFGEWVGLNPAYSSGVHLRGKGI